MRRAPLYRDVLFLYTLLVSEVVFSWHEGAIALKAALKKLFVFATIALTLLLTVSYALAAGSGPSRMAALARVGVLPATAIPETNPPTGSVTINSGQAYTNNGDVQLSLSAVDDTAVQSVRVRNPGQSWTEENYTTAMGWTVPAGSGLKTVQVQFVDVWANESLVYQDTITLDTLKPTARVFSPDYASGTSKTDDFKVSWSGADPAPASGVSSYDVRYRTSPGSIWLNWKTRTAAKSAIFDGDVGRTYYFQARSRDKAGNVGNWSTQDKTVVPFDQNILSFSGVWSSSTNTNLYKGTARYSAAKGARFTRSFSAAKEVTLIMTKRPNGGYADVYIGTSKVKTVDLYASTIKYRQAVPIKSSADSFSGLLKVIVKGAKSPASGGYRVEVDGLAIRK